MHIVIHDDGTILKKGTKQECIDCIRKKYKQEALDDEVSLMDDATKRYISFML